MKILCLSAHVDDAEIGCGGSIVKFIEEGSDIYTDFKKYLNFIRSNI